MRVNRHQRCQILSQCQILSLHLFQNRHRSSFRRTILRMIPSSILIRRMILSTCQILSRFQMTSPTSQVSNHQTLVLNIDQHRNHLAILEAFRFLLEIRSEIPSTFQPQVHRALLRLQFFLVHSPSPILSHQDRRDLTRLRFHNLAEGLDQTQIQLETLSRLKILTP